MSITTNMTGATKSHQRVWAVGDIHGARSRLATLLAEAGLIDAQGQWRAGDDLGVCVGDYFNRGPEGAAVAQWLRALQTQARAAGGDLITLLGNHEVLMCGVLTERASVPYGEVAGRWLMNGGRFRDLEALERAPDLVAWLRALPALALVNDTLFVHSDSLVYCELGATVDEVNAAVTAILRSGDLDRIAALFDQLSRRRELGDASAVASLLRHFGARRVVHGHTPTYASAPVITHDGRCVNIEGALWESDDAEVYGFVYWEAE